MKEFSLILVSVFAFPDSVFARNAKYGGLYPSVESGTFRMGSNYTPDNASPVHEVM